MAKNLTIDDLAQMMRDVDRTKAYWLASLTNILMSRSAEAGETLADRKALSDRIGAAHTRVVDEDLAADAAAYDAWFEKVDLAVAAEAGVGAADLPDQTWWVWFDDGMTPREAAEAALANSM